MLYFKLLQNPEVRRIVRVGKIVRTWQINRLHSTQFKFLYFDGATQFKLLYFQFRGWGDTTSMLGRSDLGWGDVTWGDKAMGRNNRHSKN